jgi:DNA repair protein RAD5
MDASHSKGAADSLFFAGSDDEELNVQVNSVIDSDEDDLKARLGAHAERLFLEGTDEDLSLNPSRCSPSIRGNILALGEDQPDLEMDIPTSDAEGPRSSSVATMSSDDGDAPTLQSDSARPSTKRRRLSLPPLPSSSKMARLRLDAAAPASKAGGHLADREMQVLASHYLGSFIIGNAWATAKGKGYVNPGDEILIVREDQTEKPGFKGPPSTRLARNGASKGATYKGKTKQLTLSAMMKPQPSRPPRPKVDTIVRLTNVRGFGELSPRKASSVINRTTL